MAARTFTSAGVNNLWSNAANWDTAPVDNDSVTIPAGQTCEYDVDWSSAITYPNGLVGLTITGTLNVSKTTSSYIKMKAAATISGAGTFNIGASGAGNNIPFAVKHTLTGGAAWYVQGSGGLTMNVYAAEPTYKTVKTVNAESALATRIEIDTDLTGDIWAIGDTIRIDNINKDVQSEVRVIQDIQATYIDITVGLTASKLAGSIVSLITRNVSLVGVGASGYVCQNFVSGKLTVAGGAWTTANYRVFYSCTGATISGGTFSGNAQGLYSCTGATISGGTFSGNTQGLYSCTGATISGGTFSGNTYGLGYCTGATISGGTFSGNTYGLYSCMGATISGGTFSGNTYGLYSCTGATISGGTFSGNTYGLGYCTGATISGGTFSGNMYGLGYCTGATTISGGTFSGNTQGLYSCTVSITGATFSTNTYDLRRCDGRMYNQTITTNYEYGLCQREAMLESINANGTGGAFKAWTTGGITTSVATPVPTGFVRSNQLALESATIEGWWSRRVTVPAGKTVTLTFYLQKSASMTYKPRVWVCLNGNDPFNVPATILKEFIFPDDDNDVWETDTYTYANTANYDVTLDVRFVGKKATGNVYGEMSANVLGGVGRSRIIGGA